MTLQDREMRKRPARVHALALIGAAIAVLAAPKPANAQWTLVWSDEFNGLNGVAPDPSKWTYDTGGGGFGNGELQIYCAPGSNVAPCSAANTNIFQNGAGQLVIRARGYRMSRWQGFSSTNLPPRLLVPNNNVHDGRTSFWRPAWLPRWLSVGGPVGRSERLLSSSPLALQCRWRAPQRFRSAARRTTWRCRRMVRPWST